VLYYTSAPQWRIGGLRTVGLLLLKSYCLKQKKKYVNNRSRFARLIVLYFSLLHSVEAAAGRHPIYHLSTLGHSLSPWYGARQSSIAGQKYSTTPRVVYVSQYRSLGQKKWIRHRFLYMSPQLCAISESPHFMERACFCYGTLHV